MRNILTIEYTTGKINKEQYDKLADDISIKYIEIFKIKLDSLNNISDNYKETELEKIVKILEEIHGKEGLNNEQYAKLKNEVSIIYEEIYRKRCFVA